MKAAFGLCKRPVFILLLLLGWWRQAPSTAAMQPITDAEIKATLLFKFVPFVRWPRRTTVPADNFIFLIVGNDPFGRVIDHYEGDTIRGRPLKIVRLAPQDLELDAIPACDMMYISRSVAEQLEPLLKTLERKPILTVSDQPGWGQKGIMINFFESEETVRFEINPKKTRQAGLKVGAQLLKLSRIVEPERK